MSGSLSYGTVLQFRVQLKLRFKHTQTLWLWIVVREALLLKNVSVSILQA